MVFKVRDRLGFLRPGARQAPPVSAAMSGESSPTIRGFSQKVFAPYHQSFENLKVAGDQARVERAFRPAFAIGPYFASAAEVMDLSGGSRFLFSLTDAGLKARSNRVSITCQRDLRPCGNQAQRGITDVRGRWCCVFGGRTQCASQKSSLKNSCRLLVARGQTCPLS